MRGLRRMNAEDEIATWRVDFIKQLDREFQSEQGMDSVKRMEVWEKLCSPIEG
jgi:hypothetical protein